MLYYAISCLIASPINHNDIFLSYLLFTINYCIWFAFQQPGLTSYINTYLQPNTKFTPQNIFSRLNLTRRSRNKLWAARTCGAEPTLPTRYTKHPVDIWITVFKRREGQNQSSHHRHPWALNRFEGDWIGKRCPLMAEVCNVGHLPTADEEDLRVRPT